MKIQEFAFEGEGIECVFDNGDWLMSIKNWRPQNDVENICKLEVHYKTDEQFVLLAGSAVLLYADSFDESSEVQVVRLEPGKVYNVPTGLWYNNVLAKDGKLVFVERSGTVLASDNSVYKEMTPAQITAVQAKIRAALA